MAHPKIDAFAAGADGRIMNPDGHYGFQCVDLADQYAQDIFGVPWPQSMGGVTGAKQLLDAAPDQYWIRIDNNGDPNQIPQYGDLIVWAGNAANQWGHVAFVISADVNGVDVFQQDGFARPHQYVDGNWYSAKPTHRARLGYTNPGTGHTLGWLRPRLAAAPAPTPPAPATTASYQRTTKATSQVAYREQASSNATFIKWLDADTTYDFKGFVRGENLTIDGVTSNIWYVGKYTSGYAWAGLFTSQSTAGLEDLTPQPKPVEVADPNARTVGKVAVNLRQGPGTNHDLMILPTVPTGQLKIDYEYVFKGFVRGQKVGDSDIWFVSKSGGYAHNMGFTNTSTAGLPDLTPAAPVVTAPAPTAPSVPAVPSPVAYSFAKDVPCVTEIKPAGIGHFQAGGLPQRPMKIVIHQFDAASKSVGADSVVSWFQSPDNPSWSSAHFVVHGKRIIQMVKLGDRAYHGGPGGNDYIGIETYVTAGGNDANTFNSVVKLIKELEVKYGYRFELIDHRSVSSTSCGADINIPAYRTAVSAVAPVTPPVVVPVAPAPAPTAPAVDELALFAAHLHAQIDAYVASKRK